MTHTPEKPDYASDFCWAHLPGDTDKPVDVFYVHPTIYAGSPPDNMDIADPDLRANARGLCQAQAGVYSETCNLFAPLYRQQSAAVQNDFDTERADMFDHPTFKLGASDVEAAFGHYLEKLSGGRPFILAGHSQGTMALIALMRKRFNDPELCHRLVAAYLIGYSVTLDDVREYPWMRRAKGAEDLGVVISFNTEGPGATGSPVLKPGAFSINPVNWRNDSLPADNAEHAGAVFFDDAKGRRIEEVAHFATARVNEDKGVLIVENMRAPASPEIDLNRLGRFPEGVYHRYDYAFWFNNLKKNVRQRVDAYLVRQSREG